MTEAESLVDNEGVLAMIFGPSSRVRQQEVDGLVAMAQKSADRRFRMEAMGQLYVIRHTASGGTEKKAVTAAQPSQLGVKLHMDVDPASTLMAACGRSA